MEQKIIVYFISAIGTICIGVITNYISDKLKNHSSRPTKSGMELEIKIKFKKH